MNHPHDQDAVLGGQSPGASRDAAVLGGAKGRDQAYRNHYNFSERLPNGIELAMIAVPGGTFLMGSPETELEREEKEGPQHSVTVPAFFLGRYPITQAQWRAVVTLPQINQELKPDPSHFKGDNRPVEQISRLDAAIEWCARLSQHTGREYRLPSEAEWEYACRAGTTTPFHFGATITTDLANYGIYTYGHGRGTCTYGQGRTEGDYRAETTPVDHFGIANPFGICDMHGNVQEWCLDLWHYDYEGAPIDGSAWLESKNYYRVKRGGSWFCNPGNCRSAYRGRDGPRGLTNATGFRVVCVLPRTL